MTPLAFLLCTSVALVSAFAGDVLEYGCTGRIKGRERRPLTHIETSFLEDFGHALDFGQGGRL